MDVIHPIIGFASFAIWVLVSTAFSASLMPHQQKSSFWKSTSARCMLEHLPPNKRITASVMMQQLPRHVRHFWSIRFKYNNWYIFRSRDESHWHYCKYTCYIVLCNKDHRIPSVSSLKELSGKDPDFFKVNIFWESKSVRQFYVATT